MKTRIGKYGGRHTIFVDDRPIEPLLFKTFRPTPKNISDFYKAGVRVFHVLCSGLNNRIGLPYSMFGEIWVGDHEYAFDRLDAQIDMFLQAAPGSYLIINVHLDSRPWWHEQNPGRTDSFNNLSQIAADEKWRQDTADFLQALIRHTEEKYPENVCGYHLLGGCYTEWLSEYDFEAEHPIKLKAFREYVGDDQAQIPEQARRDCSSTAFLDPVKDADLLAYRKFHNKLIADTILYFAAKAQEVLNHQKIIGVFFGYILELWQFRLWNDGHLDIDRVYRSDDIDYVGMPSSYQFRCYDQASAYMVLGDTLALNDKMWFIEMDHLTFKAPHILEDKSRTYFETGWLEGLLGIGRPDLLETREQTIDVIKREYMQSLAKNTGHWWFDMPEGWFYDDGLMGAIKNVVTNAEKYAHIPRESASEIAVFVSCESMYYVHKHCDLNSQILLNQRGALSCMGAPYDCFSLNDIDRVNLGQYKLCIFLNAFSLTEAQRNFINTKVKSQGRSCLFIGGCDYIDDYGVSQERIEQMLQMKLEQISGEDSIETERSRYGYEAAIDPVWAVTDPDADNLGRYANSKKCALAKRTLDDCVIYYSGLGNLSHEELRHIAREAGVHIYAENGVAVYVNSAFAGVYNTHDEITQLHLPVDGEFVEFFTGKVYRVRDHKVDLPTGECPAQMLFLRDAEKSCH